MTKGKRKGSDRSKEQGAKVQDRLSDAWLEYSKNMNDRILRLAKEGTEEYRQLHDIWSDYAQRMTDKLSELSPGESMRLEDMKGTWTDYSDLMGKRFLEQLKDGEGPYRELYAIWSEYSEKMNETLSEMMSERLKDQKDIYELWMDAFGIKDRGETEELYSNIETMSKFWMELWNKSKDIMSPGGEEIDYAAKTRELNDLWTKAYSRMIMEAMRSRAFAEMTGTMLDRNLDLRRMNEQFVSQYMNTVGLPTKENMNDIYRKLHELDRKVSDISRTLSSSRTPRKH